MRRTYKHFAEQYFEEQYFDIISLNETMLDSSISDYEIKINGYDIVRKDRNRHGGGVAIYLRNSLNYTVRDDLTDESLETLTLEITKPKAKQFIVNSWYRPPNSSQECLNTYENLITQMIPKIRKLF